MGEALVAAVSSACVAVVGSVEFRTEEQASFLFSGRLPITIKKVTEGYLRLLRQCRIGQASRKGRKAAKQQAKEDKPRNTPLSWMGS